MGKLAGEVQLFYPLASPSSPEETHSMMKNWEKSKNSKKCHIIWQAIYV